MARDKDRNKRGVRDQAGVGPEPRETRHLTPMKELKKFRVASGEPDVRGWTVYTSNGRELGKVEDLLVDTSRGEVVMLDVDLRESDRHTLAPIRAAWVDRDAKRVVLDGAQFDAEEEIPSLRRGQLSDEDTRSFRDRYVRAYGARGFGDDEYRVGRDDSEVRFGRRRDDRADAAEDEYEIERVRPEERTARAADAGEERDDWSDVRYPSRGSDEQVIERRPVVVEETVVRRRVLGGDEADERSGERRPPGSDEHPEERR